MGENDYSKEKIRYYIEWIRLLWIAILALGGGIASLIISLDNPIKSILFIIGLLFLLIFFTLLMLVHSWILNILEAIKKGGNV